MLSGNPMSSGSFLLVSWDSWHPGWQPSAQQLLSAIPLRTLLSNGPQPHFHQQNPRISSWVGVEKGSSSSSFFPPSIPSLDLRCSTCSLPLLSLYIFKIVFYLANHL